MKNKLAVYLLYTQLIYFPVRPKTNRVLRHVQMRQLDLSKFKKFTRSIRQKEIQIVKEQKCQAKRLPFKNFLHLYMRLSATASQKLVEPDGIEPTTSCVQGRRSPN